MKGFGLNYCLVEMSKEWLLKQLIQVENKKIREKTSPNYTRKQELDFAVASGCRCSQ